VSSLLLDTARRLVGGESFDTRSRTVGLVAVLLLLTLLVAADVLGALAGRRARALRADLTIAIGPLLVAFAVIVGTRIGHLL
jgi:hypothetical protein